MHAARLGLAFALALLPGCGDSPALTVFAASSLSDAFPAVAREFEHLHPGVRVRLSFAGSSTLAAQIREGAPADVFAAADQETMETVAGLIDGEPSVFARTQLAIAVRPGNPRRIAALGDLARDGLVVVVCAEQVPCGRRTAEALSKARVRVAPASEEPTVRFALSKVVLGEADAAIVYATDVFASAGRAEAVAIPEEHNAEAVFPIAVLNDAPRRSQAAAFVEYVLSAAGRETLARFGFLPP